MTQKVTSNDKVLDSVRDIAIYVRELCSELPEEEKWTLALKLNGRSFDLTQDLAEGIGSIDPRDAKWHFGQARRDVFGLINALKMYQRYKYGTIDPDVMIRLQDTISVLDKMIDEATANIPKWFKEMSAPEGNI